MIKKQKEKKCTKFKNNDLAGMGRLKSLYLKHFSLPWMLFEVGGAVFIMNSKIHLRKISLKAYFKAI